MIVSEAFASVGEPSVSMGSSLMPFLLVLAIFWILLIRPQQKKMKEHDELVANLKIGDKVITTGGIIGKISKVDKEKGVFLIKIANSVEIELVNHAVHKLVKEETESSKVKNRGIKKSKKKN